MVTVDVSLNPNYGGKEVSKKYSPLLESTPENSSRTPLKLNLEKSKELIDVINTKRIDFFKNLSIWPNTLTFYSKYEKNIIIKMIKDTENYPMVVVSSNRSKFIFEHANLWYRKFKQRTIIIVVHSHEYSTYKENLKTLKSIIVIGWQVAEGYFGETLLGFGGTRFAAFELSKFLDLSVAWFIDDNVWSITQKSEKTDKDIDSDENVRFFEGILKNNNLTAISFKGANEQKSLQQITEISKKSLNVFDYYTKNQERTKKGGIPIISKNKGVLQQLVLWNIKLLNEFTIGPYFLASKEDVTLSEFLPYVEKNYIIFGDFNILKLEIDKTKEDKTLSKKEGAVKLQKQLNDLKNLVMRQEEAMDGILYTSKLYEIDESEDHKSDLKFRKCITDLTNLIAIKLALVELQFSQQNLADRDTITKMSKMIIEYSNVNVSRFKGFNPPIQAAEQVYRKSLLTLLEYYGNSKNLTDDQEKEKEKICAIIRAIFSSPLKENINWQTITEKVTL